MKAHIIAAAAILTLSTQPIFAQGRYGLLKKAALWVIGGTAAATTAYVFLKPEDFEAKVLEKTQKDLDENKDKFFHQLHPVGQAKTIKVHEIKSFWKTDNPKSMNDLKGFVVRYTIYWEGPIQKDGFTKLISAYDAEVERYTASEIIETNGITNKDAMEAVGALLTVCINN